MPEGVEVAVYDVIGLPPLKAGATKATLTCELPIVPTTPVGAPGTVAGITALDGADAGPVPDAFVAVTVNVYEVPFVRPVTIIGLVAFDAVFPPGLDITVYMVTGVLPLGAGAVKLTIACPEPGTAVTAVGAFCS